MANGIASLMKPTASLPLATGLAALAVGASVLLSAPEAKALCIDGNSVCTTFDPGSLSSPTSVQPTGGFTFTGGDAIVAARGYNRIGIEFSYNGTPSPFELKNLKVEGFNTGGLISLGDLLIDNLDLNAVETAFTETTGSLISSNLASYKISFDIPAGVNLQSTITSRLVFSRGGSNSIQSTNFFDTTAVPGPLPILGAGVAFGCSRSLRRKIKVAKSA